MTYKQFRKWCSERAVDGCWDYDGALYCLDLITSMERIPFWRRRKVWKQIEHKVIFAVVEPIEKKLKEIRGAADA